MKKRILELSMAMLLLLGAFVLSRQVASYVEAMQSPIEQKEAMQTYVEQKIVVIDAGHGGQDPGKVGVNNVLEKDINLKIALELKTLLEEQNVKVVLTRDTDEGLNDADASNKKIQDMTRRVEIIDETSPDLVVSIHQNSYQEESVKGPQVFYYTHSVQAQTLAEIIQEQLNTDLAIERPRMAKANDSYYLLKKTEGTTVIVECGFLSNSEEEQLLNQEDYQKKLAISIKDGIMSYLNNNL